MKLTGKGKSGQYRAASDPSRAESILDPQKSGRAADEQGRGRLDDRNQITQLCFPRRLRLDVVRLISRTN